MTDLPKRESQAAASANDHVKDEKHRELSKLTAGLIMGDSVSDQSSLTAIAQALDLQCLVVLKTPTEVTIFFQDLERAFQC